MQSEMLKHFSPTTQLRRLKVKFVRILKTLRNILHGWKMSKSLGRKMPVQIGKELLEEKGQAQSIFYCCYFPVFYSDKSFFLCILNVVSINFFFSSLLFDQTCL